MRATLIPDDSPLEIVYSPPPREEIPEAPATTSSTVAVTASFEDVRKALSYVPNDDLGYDAWFKVICAIHSATGGDGLPLAHEWSGKSGKHDPEFLDTEVWPYLRDRENGITARTLFHIADEHGFPQIDENDFDVLEPYVEPPPTAAKLERFRIVERDEFLRRPPPRWWIHKVLPQAELGVIYGESTAGKSFAALDLAGALDQGTPWRGHRTTQARVVIICAEGAGDFRNRVDAYERHHGVSLHIGIIPDTPNLMERDDVKALGAVLQARGVDVLIVDTFAQTTVGADENSAKDVGKAIGHCRALHRATGATVVLVHHAGKDVAKGARGSSALKAACDFELEVTRNGFTRALRVSKLKNGQDGAQYPFKLLTVPLGRDEEGEEIDSCVIEATAAKGSLRKPKGKHEVLVWQVAHDLSDLGDGPLAVRDVLDAVREKMVPMPSARGVDRRADVIRRALQELQSQGFVAISDDQLTLCNS